jgi:hypothetical protein
MTRVAFALYKDVVKQRVFLQPMLTILQQPENHTSK